jgi:hypothetical protein
MPFHMRPRDPKRADTIEDTLARMVEAALNGEMRVSEGGLTAVITRNGQTITGSAAHGSNQLGFTGLIAPVRGRAFAVQISGQIRMKFRLLMLPVTAQGTLPSGTIIFAKADGSLHLEPHTRFELTTNRGIDKTYEPGFTYGIDP